MKLVGGPLLQLWRARSVALHTTRTATTTRLCSSVSASASDASHPCTPPRPEKVHKRQVPISFTGVNDQGDGVGVDDASGVQVHVPFALPGEQLLVEVWERDLLASLKWKASKRKPKWPVLGQKVETLAPSEHRVTPRCAKFFGACGGCKQQHLAYAEQLFHKQKRVEALFQDREHSPQMQLRAILGADADGANDAPGIYHYRNKMEFTCSTGRWLLDSDKVQEEEEEEEDGIQQDEDSADKPLQPQQQFPFTIGLFPASSTSVRRARQLGGKRRRGKTNASWSPRILSIDDCLLQDPAGNEILKLWSTRLQGVGLEAFNFQTNRGFLKQFVLRKGVNVRRQTEIMVGLVTTSLDGEQSDVLTSVVDELVREFHNGNHASDATIVSVVQCLDEQSLRLHRRDNKSVAKEKTLFGQAYFHDTILDHSFQVSFDSFFQPNTSQASRLYREIQKTMALNQDASSDARKKPVIWDLFCGVGSIGICMGKLGSKVYGFEIVGAAVEKAKVNAQLNGYSDEEMQFFAMDLTKKWDENEWTGKVETPDVVIVDPPRAGLHSKLVKLLRRLGPPQICYVSCNPESQVRDLELLCKQDEDEEGSTLTSAYEVEFLQPVDMLPHTPHIETIAWLRRRA